MHLYGCAQSLTDAAVESEETAVKAFLKRGRLRLPFSSVTRIIK